jgi:hypothetical protein
MNFSEFSLENLYSLYESCENMIKNYKDALEAIQPNQGEKAALIKQMISNLEFKFEEIRKEINKKYNGESNYSREWVFHKSYIQKKPLIVELRSGSEAYNDYGRTLVGWGKYNEIEIEELLKNIVSTPPQNTNGYVKFELVEKDLPDDKLLLLETKGLKTNDISMIKGRF